ncbi:MAG TPA: chemotaxis protein CheB, partial [Nitrospiraceae bacterium]|nr:chemotaxis protein CheB [Nitrospiraceae bacterium]
DGVAGLIAIKQHGGLGLVQDPKDAKIRSMPLNALRYDHVDLALPLSAIPTALALLAEGRPVH